MERGSTRPKKSPQNRVLPSRFRTFLVLDSHVGVWILLELQDEREAAKKKIKMFKSELGSGDAEAQGEYRNAWNDCRGVTSLPRRNGVKIAKKKPP